MHLYSTLLYLTLSASSALALPPRDVNVKPPYFALAGDSTTAVQSEGGGGWGTGFLNTTLRTPAKGKNFGHNGATTVSFREGGDWANVLAAAKAASKDYEPYVTIQFGHNDQKPAKNISMEEFTNNLVTFVKDVRAVSATPILVTPLSRRSFDSSGHVVMNLADVTAATKKAAEQTGAHIIDLNAASTKYLNAIGEDRAHTYNLVPSDNTHLNNAGTIVFGTMVAMLINQEVPEVEKQYVIPVADIADKIEKGEWAFAYF
jgi:lysophospholipase L1-like esterase